MGVPVVPLVIQSSSGSVSVELASSLPLGPVYSPTHRIDVARPGPRKARVGFESSHEPLDRDLKLVFAPAERGVGVELLAYRRGQIGKSIGIRHGLYDLARSLAAFFGLPPPPPPGESFLDDVTGT